MGASALPYLTACMAFFATFGFSKSLSCAWSTQDVVDSLQTLVWNLVWGGYAQSWWKPSFRRCWEKYGLVRIFPLSQMHAWIRQARKCRGSR